MSTTSRLRTRLTALVVASTLTLGAVAIDTPAATAAEPSLIAMSASSALNELTQTLQGWLILSVGLSSYGLAFLLPPENVCTGLLPRPCFD